MKKRPTKKQAKINKQFYDTALDFTRNFVNNRFSTFTTEDIKREYFLSGGVVSVNPTIWGCIMRKLSKEELIYKHSTANAKNRESHQRLLQVWISKSYRLKQQANAKRESTMNLFEH